MHMPFCIIIVPVPSISIHNHTTPYNGTNFTLTAEIELHPNVDTNVTVARTWYNSNGKEVQLETTITSPPYLTNLTFQPLATNSSGVYTLVITVQPLDNSSFIVDNLGAMSYNLTVRRMLKIS